MENLTRTLTVSIKQFTQSVGGLTQTEQTNLTQCGPRQQASEGLVMAVNRGQPDEGWLLQW